MKDNLREFDVIRAISALSVIAIHITSSQFPRNPVALVWDALMWYAVPIFIILSGFTLHNKHKDIEKLDYWSFVKMRASKVLLPYILWTLIYMIYDFKSKGIQIPTIHFLTTFISNLFTGNGFAHLYFMVIIIQYYLLYPLFKWALKREPNWVIGLSIVITILFQFDPVVHLWEINWLPHWLTPYNVILFPRWSLYFVFGLIIGENREVVYQWLVKRRFQLYSAWALVAIILVLQTYTYQALKPMSYPTILVYSTLSFMLLWIFGDFLKDKNSQYVGVLDWISRNSFVIYLCHLLLVRLIAIPLVSILGFNIWDGTKGLFALYIFTVIISCYFARFLSLMPGGQILGAIKRKDRLKDASPNRSELESVQ